MAASQPSGFVAVGEAALDEFAAPPQQALTVLASHSSPVRIDRSLLLAFVLPVPPAFLLLLRNVAAHLVTLHLLQYRAAVIPLVRNQFLDPEKVDLRLLFRMQSDLALDQSSHRHPGLDQRLIQSRGVALVGRL